MNTNTNKTALDLGRYMFTLLTVMFLSIGSVVATEIQKSKNVLQNYHHSQSVIANRIIDDPNAPEWMKANNHSSSLSIEGGSVTRHNNGMVSVAPEWMKINPGSKSVPHSLD